MTQAVIVAGVAPAKAAVKLPPPAWFEEMRTPSAEVLLAEFRQHLDGAGDQADTDMPAACAPEAEAEGEIPSLLSKMGPMALVNARWICRGSSLQSALRFDELIVGGFLLRGGIWS